MKVEVQNLPTGCFGSQHLQTRQLMIPRSDLFFFPLAKKDCVSLLLPSTSLGPSFSLMNLAVHSEFISEYQFKFKK